MLYPRKGSKDISDITPRQQQFLKVPYLNLEKIYNLGPNGDWG
jgi:hypothetical protein